MSVCVSEWSLSRSPPLCVLSSKTCCIPVYKSERRWKGMLFSLSFILDGYYIHYVTASFFYVCCRFVFIKRVMIFLILNFFCRWRFFFLCLENKVLFIIGESFFLEIYQIFFFFCRSLALCKQSWLYIYLHFDDWQGRCTDFMFKFF